MKKNILSFTIFLCFIAVVASVSPLFAIDKALPSDPGALSYTWVSDRMDGMPWGLEVGDLDGDKDDEILLLHRDFLEIGRFKDGAFVRSASCNFKDDAKGARLDLFDTDGDGDYEAVVTAITIGKPTAMVIDYDSTGCRVVKSEIPWSFRAISGGEQDGLYGQWWSGQKYFSGPVYSMEISKKIKKRERLLLPRFASLYDFLILPKMGEEYFVLLQKSYSPLEIRRREGRSFKRFWKSSEKFGGSINYLPASSRNVMGEESSEIAIFDLPPVTIKTTDGILVAAVQNDMPIRSIVGRTPYVKDSMVVFFRPDPVLGLVEKSRTPKLPGAIVDFAVVPRKDGSDSIYVVVHEGGDFFMKSTSSRIFRFDF